MRLDPMKQAHKEFIPALPSQHPEKLILLVRGTTGTQQFLCGSFPTRFMRNSCSCISPTPGHPSFCAMSPQALRTAFQREVMSSGGRRQDLPHHPHTPMTQRSQSTGH